MKKLEQLQQKHTRNIRSAAKNLQRLFWLRAGNQVYVYKKKPHIGAASKKTNF